MGNLEVGLLLHHAERSQLRKFKHLIMMGRSHWEKSWRQIETFSISWAFYDVCPYLHHFGSKYLLSRYLGLKSGLLKKFRFGEFIANSWPVDRFLRWLWISEVPPDRAISLYPFNAQTPVLQGRVSQLLTCPKSNTPKSKDWIAFSCTQDPQSPASD